MEEKLIETRLVQGFMDAGKTTFIQDCILNDYFHKYGDTLILCFEQGEKEYDIEALGKRRTSVEYYEGDGSVSEFCLRMIEKHHPDRIYVEMNEMTPGLREAFVPSMNVTFVSVWIEWQTLDLYVRNLQQLMNQMVSGAHQVTFRGCPSKELLAPYSQLFRLMNHKATYLRQDPMGYHEKAFDLFVPWDADAKEITVSEDTYLLFWLDAADHPEHYDQKTIIFTDPLEIRQTDNSKDGGHPAFSAGRIVMTCCMADLQFMGFMLCQNQNDPDAENSSPDTGWFLIHAAAKCRTGEYGRRTLTLSPFLLEHAAPPSELILSAQG